MAGVKPGAALRALVDDAPVVPLIAISGLVLAASAWCLLAPDRVLSRAMTWDLLFNLAGAWHLHNGHVVHVDFHDPIGQLYFRLTELGFWLRGPTVLAFGIGKAVMATVLWVAAVVASARRLPLLPALVFVVLAVELVLMPGNVGAMADEYTFAMSYNAYGWSGLIVLSLILFLPPRVRTDLVWLDAAIGGALIVILYYLKVTYFAVAMAELAIALLVCSHVRTQWLPWGIVALVTALNAIAPYNWAYLGDILAAVGSGAVRAHTGDLFIKLLGNVPELALYATAFVIALGLWRTGRAPQRLPAAAAALIVLGAAALSQNTQARGIAVGVVILFLLYDQLRGATAVDRPRGTAWLLAALLILPAAEATKAAVSVAGYYLDATRGSGLLVVEGTNLRGLAVPSQADLLLDAFSVHKTDYTLLNRARTVGATNELAEFEYVETLLEAAALFDRGTPGRSGGIVVLDQVNPLPFMLGRPPPRGGSLWLGPAFPWPPEEAMFAEADFVLIPKFSTSFGATRKAIGRYKEYLAERFPVRSESRSWILLSRRVKP